MGAYYSAERLVDYAREQAERGWQMLRSHVVDQTGCCRRCGRTHPCPDRQRGGDLVVWYGHWQLRRLALLGAAAEGSAAPGAALVATGAAAGATSAAPVAPVPEAAAPAPQAAAPAPVAAGHAPGTAGPAPTGSAGRNVADAAASAPAGRGRDRALWRRSR